MYQMNKERIHKYRRWFSAAVILIFVIVIFLLLRCCGSKQLKDNNNTIATTSQNELDFTPANESDNTIQLPIVSGLNMRAGQLQQTVDFYNPNKSCYFVISLYLSDGTLIYKSDMIAPSEHITEITLLQALQRGIYSKCKMVFDCYALDKTTALNGGSANIEINSQ